MRHKYRHLAQRGYIRYFLEPCLLMVLRMGKSHGHELSQAMVPFGLGDVDSGLVNAVLRQMEASGLIASEWDVEATSDAPRRIYRLTEQGDRRLSAWVDELRDTEHLLHCFFETYAEYGPEGDSDES